MRIAISRAISQNSAASTSWPADEALQPVDIELGVAGALVFHQQKNGVADDRRGVIGQVVGQERQSGIVLADDIGEQITQGGDDAGHCYTGLSGGLFSSGLVSQADLADGVAPTICCSSRRSSVSMFWNSRALVRRRK